MYLILLIKNCLPLLLKNLIVSSAAADNPCVCLWEGEISKWALVLEVFSQKCFEFAFAYARSLVSVFSSACFLVWCFLCLPKHVKSRCICSRLMVLILHGDYVFLDPDPQVEARLLVISLAVCVCVFPVSLFTKNEPTDDSGL